MLEGVKTLFISHLCLIKLLKSIKDPHFNFETFSNQCHLMSPVLGCQVFLPLLFILTVGGEVDILVPHIRSVVSRWRCWGWRGLYRHGCFLDWQHCFMIGSIFGWLAHFHVDQGGFLKTKLESDPVTNYSPIVSIHP